MSMLYIRGSITNTFKKPPFTDRNTGKTTPEKHYVQLLCDVNTANNELKKELFSLSVENENLYKENLGKIAEIPIGVFVNDGAIIYYALKQEKPKFY